MNDDAVLAAKARTGDRAAFEELVRRTTRLVFARVCLETGDPAGAEDLVQEAYLQAWKSIRQLAEPQGFRAWLCAVTQSVCIDHFRRAGRQRRAAPPRSPEAALEGVAAGEAPDSGLEQGEARSAVLSILRSLPEEYRGPLTLRYLGGADHATIADQLGISPGSLRGLLNRGLQLLRAETKRALGVAALGGTP